MLLNNIKNDMKNILSLGNNCNYKLVEVELKGGFGNQLFQFAAGVSFALDNRSAIFFHDLPPITNDPLNIFALKEIGILPGIIYDIENEFGSLKFTKTEIVHKCRGSVYKEKYFSFKPIQTNKSHVVINGYFQSFKYFEKYKNQLRDYLRDELEIQNNKVKSNFIIQIRLGDLLTNPSANAIHGVVSEEFIEKLLQISATKNLVPSVITDDIFNASKAYPVLSERKDIKVSSGDAVSDFKTMIESSNLAISNSTFGWWAAWLSFGKVYAPKQWFVDNSKMGFVESDFFPEEWIVL